MGEPLLRWAGSKKKLLPMLTSATPAHRRRYIEPFVGSAALFMKLGEGSAILGDLNQNLVAAYKVIRGHPRAVWNRVSKMSLEPDYYYELRAVDVDSLGGGCSPIIFGAASLGAYLEETEGAFRNQFYLLTLNHDDHQQLRGRLRVWDWYQGHGWKPANRGGAGLYDGSGFGNRNVAATVAAVARAAQGNLPMTWEKVTQAVPDTAFLSVADEDIMISRLKTSHQITARFKADGSWETLEKALT